MNISTKNLIEAQFNGRRRWLREGVNTLMLHEYRNAILSQPKLEWFYRPGNFKIMLADAKSQYWMARRASSDLAFNTVINAIYLFRRPVMGENIMRNILLIHGLTSSFALCDRKFHLPIYAWATCANVEVFSRIFLGADASLAYLVSGCSSAFTLNRACDEWWR